MAADVLNHSDEQIVYIGSALGEPLMPGMTDGIPSGHTCVIFTSSEAGPAGDKLIVSASIEGYKEVVNIHDGAGGTWTLQPGESETFQRPPVTISNRVPRPSIY